MSVVTMLLRQEKQIQTLILHFILLQTYTTTSQKIKYLKRNPCLHVITSWGGCLPIFTFLSAELYSEVDIFDRNFSIQWMKSILQNIFLAILIQKWK